MIFNASFLLGLYKILFLVEAIHPKEVVEFLRKVGCVLHGRGADLWTLIISQMF